MNTLPVITDKEISKEIIANKSFEIIRGIQEGEIDPLKAHIIAKANIKMWEEIAKESTSYAMAEAEKYGKDAKVMGAEVKISSTGATYNFEEDETYLRLKEEFKARENLLKEALKSSGELVVEGELIPKVSLKSPAKQTLTVTIK